MNDTIQAPESGPYAGRGERLMNDTIKRLKVDLMLIGGNA